MSCITTMELTNEARHLLNQLQAQKLMTSHRLSMGAVVSELILKEAKALNLKTTQEQLQE
ncbi:hypothetical protein [Parendozoicomonas haliclonae]|uniref:Uncharacterized protein n=1 Tax=Parendozoicomonas haliclonae TaxID=1960125 RepID=A0A1X7AKJ9_9GAMM|nr:hypothetical protein [Parendozoicomonas haliclonae]SMA47370.1 hypothetical protein EHSB41UT_02388 [Parendozoicomonas haliclonae]